MTGDRFTVLFVCHANLCRSPMAERLARKSLVDAFSEAGTEVTVVSAGTHARAGMAMHPGTVRVLAERGADVAGFGSQRLTAESVAGADLILTATRAQRAACARLAPAAVSRAFTIHQFGRLVAVLPPLPPRPGPRGPALRMRTLLDQAQQARSGLQPPLVAEDDDLVDPVQRPIEAFRICATEVQGVLDAMMHVISKP